jgi:hypothetical protein
LPSRSFPKWDANRSSVAFFPLCFARFLDPSRAFPVYLCGECPRQVICHVTNVRCVAGGKKVVETIKLALLGWQEAAQTPTANIIVGDSVFDAYVQGTPQYVRHLPHLLHKVECMIYSNTKATSEPSPLDAIDVGTLHHKGCCSDMCASLVAVLRPTPAVGRAASRYRGTWLNASHTCKVQTPTHTSRYLSN